MTTTNNNNNTQVPNIVRHDPQEVQEVHMIISIIQVKFREWSLLVNQGHVIWSQRALLLTPILHMPHIFRGWWYLRPKIDLCGGRYYIYPLLFYRWVNGDLESLGEVLPGGTPGKWRLQDSRADRPDAKACPSRLVGATFRATTNTG